MKYIVLDLEYNQAFDFVDGKAGTPNEKCPFEIIQIGAVKLNEAFEYEAAINLLIKPQLYKRMHPYVEKITGLTRSMLDNQQEFKQAYEKLLNFCKNDDAVFCVWGGNDIKELHKNITFFHDNKIIENMKFLNVQAVASKFLNNAPGMCIGLRNAVMELHIEIIKPFHNALHDAEYTAKILQLLQNEELNISEFSINNVEKTSKSIKIIDFIRLYRFIEKELGRRLTRKEKRIYRNVYFFGRDKKYDSNKESE